MLAFLAIVAIAGSSCPLAKLRKSKISACSTSRPLRPNAPSCLPFRRVWRSNELMPKRYGLLTELVPRAGVIALLVNPKNPFSERMMPDVQAAARAKGVQLHMLKAGTESEIDAAFAILARVRFRPAD